MWNLEMLQKVNRKINKITTLGEILAVDVDCIFNKPFFNSLCKNPCKLRKCWGQDPLTFSFYWSDGRKFGNQIY